MTIPKNPTIAPRSARLAAISSSKKYLPKFKFNPLFVIFAILFLPIATFAVSWPPSSIVTPGHPHILFTQADSAEIASTLGEWPRSSYYNSIWSRANGSSGNDSETADMGRAAIAQSAAFVLYFGVQPSGDTMTTAQRTALQTKVIDYMENIRFPGEITIYSNGSFHYPCQRLIQYAVAADLLQARGITYDNSAFLDLADEIYSKATYWLFTYVVDDVTLFANHKLIVAGGLGMAALAYPDHGEDWINYSMTKIEKVMFTEETSPTALTGFAEGPHYFKYAIEHMAMLFMGLRNYIGDQTLAYTDPCGGDDNASVRSQYFDPRYDRLYEWISSIRLPDGTVPTLDDGFRHEGFCFTAPFAERDPSYYWNTPGGGSRIYVNVMMCAAGADTAGPMPAGLTSLPDAGNLIFRSGDERGLYFHMLAENGVANTNIHDQSDACSFIIHAFREDLAMDPGYIHYDERGRVNGVTSHNTILVNGGGPSAGSPADSWIEKTFEIPGVYYGEASTSYSSSDIHRRSFLLDDIFIVMTDGCSSGSSREFTFQCHAEGLTGDGTFTASPCGGRWTENAPANLDLLVTSENGLASLDIETSTHEVSYNSWADHNVVRARKSGTQVRFGAVMIPSHDDEGLPRTEEIDLPGELAGRFGFLGREGVILGSHEAGVISWGGDWIFPEVWGHGSFMTVLLDSTTSKTKNIVLIDTDSLRMSDGTRIVAAMPMLFALDIDLDTDMMTGINRGVANTIEIDMPDEPTLVTGATSYSWSDGVLTMQLAENATFTIDMTPLNIHEEMIEKGLSHAYPNPFNSRVEIELPDNVIELVMYNIDGVEVDRISTDASSIIWQPEGLPSGAYPYVIKTFDGMQKGGVLIYMK